ncbi:hypothetical protein SBOR_1456 [Sclerotinia borealis F-4128]|uniref:Uncharacterized protein n=1 Tax=Sclerotinia borealis (strain F-4128) TaxID=1432307 RepID=W9CQ18_SCLBF|nr:hypothetical protein SBOR_1456 [Sclerotinia borealis F-4128]
MARIKVPPIATQDSTSTLEKRVGSSESQETSSISFTSISSTPTCPNCSATFAESTETDFLHHVAACSRPSTAESVGTVTTSGSSLSPPPTSPGTAISALKHLSNRDVHFNYNAVQEPAIANADEENLNSNAHDLIQPYIDPNSKFDYYDQIEGHEELAVDINDPDIGLKFKYSKLPPVSHFEKFLKNPSELSYAETYRRTEIVSMKVLAVWQKEFDVIDEEIYAFESQEKERVQMEKETEKAAEEADRVAEQLEKDDLVAMAKEWAIELKFKAPEWLALMNQFDEDDEYRQRLESLRDPQFRAKLQKQAFVRQQEKQKLLQKEWKELNKPKLLSEPLPEIKLTKEEIEAEKRKAGRLMDSTKWNDMKEADVYGFEYSSHPKHLGAQPIPIASRKRGFGEVDMSEGRSGRAQRMATRKMYDQSTPEDESDTLPAKRQRKMRVLDDDLGELSKVSRKQSRSQTPVRRTFASGKPIGRPPKSLSKLKDVQLASGEDEPMPEDDAMRGEDISRHLLPAEQTQLQQSAESLVNQIAEKLPVEPVVKKKHAGGRPRKHPLPVPAPVTAVDIITSAEEVTTAPSETPAAIVPPIKPKIRVIKPKKQLAKSAKSAKSGSRVRKEANIEPSAETEEENAILPTTEHDEDSHSQRTEPVNSRPSSSSSQATISSYGNRHNNRSSTREQALIRETRTAARNRAAASVEKIVSTQDSPRKAARGTRKSGSSETAVTASQLPKVRKPRGKQAASAENVEVEPSHEPVIKKEATPVAHPIISPPSSRIKRKRISSEAVTETLNASPTKKARKSRPSKSLSTPTDGPAFISTASPKTKPNKKAKGPLARILPPRELSTRARRAPKAVRNADGAANENDEDEGEDDLNLPATEYERYLALADPKSSVTLGKRVRKSVIDLRTAMEGGDDEDGDDEFEG